MKKAIVDLLCCPICKGTLVLQVDSEVKGEIQTGSLTCGHCKITYPISEGIPDLLPREPASA